MKFILASVAIASAEASTLGITWSDCQAKHTTITDLQPTTIQTGAQETLTGYATVDEAVKAATFTATVKAHGVQVAKCSGDGLSDIVCNLPLGAGSITVAAISYPMGPGKVSLDVHVKTRAKIPSSLAKVDAHIAAQDGNGEGVVCLDVHTQAEKAAVEEEFPAFKEWAATYQKSYNGEDEASKREAIYNGNVEWIKAHQHEAHGFTIGVNQFADFTNDEFKQFLTLHPAKKPEGQAYLGKHTFSGDDLPTDIDWSTRNAVSPVKNQGTCGSCWAFSTVGSLEGRAAIATGNLQQFSEQQFVDCDTAEDQGCNGGLMDNAFKYLMQSEGLCTEDSYSYKGKVGTCQAGSCTVGLQASAVTGYKDVDADSNALAEAVAGGPVSVAIEADGLFFQLYKHGVFSSNLCGSNIDHGVLVVGYGVDDGKEYWKVKNSWGPKFGEEGFIRMLKGTKGAKGQCGILTGPPSFPVIGSDVTV